MDGLFVNADADFDSKEFRRKYFKYEIIPNTAINTPNGSNSETIIFDEELYGSRLYNWENKRLDGFIQNPAQ